MSALMSGRHPASQSTHPSRRALGGLVLTQFLLVLDSAVVNIALPTIGTDLQAPLVQLSWVVSAYAISFGGLLLLGGRLADVVGRRRLFVLGVLLFALASAAGAAAGTAAALIAARALQGLGAALAAPAALALLSTLYPDPRARGRALGLFAAAAGAGGSTGLLLGGLLTELAGWRPVLWVNVPIAALILTAVPALPQTPSSKSTRLALPAALLATSATVTFVAATIQAPQAGWTSPRTVLPFGTSLLLLAAFVHLERRSRSPLIPRALLRTRGVLRADLVSAALAAAMTPMWFLLAVHLKTNIGLEPLEAGSAVLPLSLTMVAANLLAPRMLPALGARGTLVVGAGLASGGLLWLSSAVSSGSTSSLLLPSVATAAGLGAAFVVGALVATVPVGTADSGSAAGMISTAQQAGGAVGLAVAVAVASATSSDGQVPGGIPVGLAVTAAFALLAAGLAVSLPRRLP